MAPISGAPRTCMDLMACAASRQRADLQHGQLVRQPGLIDDATDQPFLPSQMVR